jgi:Protein of unknown function (DUF3604)
MNSNTTARFAGHIAAISIGGFLALPSTVGAAPSVNVAAGVPIHTEREAYYGDLHLFSNYAFAAYGSAVDPDGAYRFARGEPQVVDGKTVQRASPPLDFLAVTDPAEDLGLFNTLDDPKSAFSNTDIGRAVGAHDPDAFRKIIDLMFISKKQPYLGVDAATANAAAAAAWRLEIEAANHNYVPGKFTTFIAYHWTNKDDANNMDRVVLFRGNTAPTPFSSFDSAKPEDLWTYLEHSRQQGNDALAIPHHSNISGGTMFNGLDSEGKPIDRAYAKRRAVNEPLIELANISQSETHPVLSPQDEFASFELFGLERATKLKGSYVRDALGRGLEILQRIGVNPYSMGFVGGTDLGAGLSDAAENAYLVVNRNLGPVDPPAPSEVPAGVGGLYPELRMTPTTSGSGSLAGVWAQQNTREAIFAAFRRRETFATSGTRLRFRFFAGWHYADDLLQSKEWVKTAYRDGVAMGGDLPAKTRGGQTPIFVAWATKDSTGANLDRLQIVKVWTEADKQTERVYDVALSGKRTVDPRTGKAPAVGNTVDVHTATYTNSIGTPELGVVWRDPQFDAQVPAVYYLRVLEIPTPRWSTIDAVKHGRAPPLAAPATIQERGWSSPIWYTPPVS